MRKLGLQDFITRLERRGDCLEYVGPRNQYGYGTFGKSTFSHRYSYSMFVGEIGDLQVLHTCDNPPCVLPAHLWLGTHEDNMLDKKKKGRQGLTDNCGKCGGPWDYYNYKRRGYVCKACTRSRDSRKKKGEKK